jgi:hypothetical protein
MYGESAAKGSSTKGSSTSTASTIAPPDAVTRSHYTPHDQRVAVAIMPASTAGMPPGRPSGRCQRGEQPCVDPDPGHIPRLLDALREGSNQATYTNHDRR